MFADVGRFVYIGVRACARLCVCLCEPVLNIKRYMPDYLHACHRISKKKLMCESHIVFDVIARIKQKKDVAKSTSRDILLRYTRRTRTPIYSCVRRNEPSDAFSPY